ncbi:MAG: hypothetical protein M3373_10875 [Gemmatimonadota bacterium]|nr:hypothetical protein [Gemmatimonadota bacterium]
MSESADERPDLAALRELDGLIRTLGDEMAGWRRRAQQAEARARELERVAQLPLQPMQDERVATVERENDELRRRLDLARRRTQQLMERVRFLRQQATEAKR